MSRLEKGPSAFVNPQVLVIIEHRRFVGHRQLKWHVLGFQNALDLKARVRIGNFKMMSDILVEINERAESCRGDHPDEAGNRALKGEIRRMEMQGVHAATDRSGIVKCGAVTDLISRV